MKNGNADMNHEGSYKIKKIAKNAELEVLRLKAQVELFWDKELKFYKDNGLKDGMSIVEFGSGPGFVTEKLLNEFPNSNVTSMEIDSYLVEAAEKYLKEKGLGRYKIIQGSITNTKLEENSFDFAITRLVLEHIPIPLDAINEVYRVLNPGGKAIFTDNDFEMHLKTFPPIPELRFLYEAYCESRFDEGGNPLIGRELPIVMKKGGFINVDFDLISAHSEIIGDEVFLESEGVGIPAQLVQDGYLKSKVLAQIAVKWSKMLKNENHAIIRQLSIVVGEKSGGALESE